MDSIVLDTHVGRIAAQALGPENGEPVLALHGWLDNAATYERLAALLASDGIRFVAIDLPGHGHSEHRPASGSYDFVSWVPVVFAVADTLGWSQLSLVGHSLGAGIAAIAAGTLPERVRRLVMIEGFGPLTTEAEQAPERLKRHVEEMPRLRAAQARVYADLDQAARVWQTAAGMALESARILVTRGTREVDGGFTWRWDARLRGASALRMTEAQVLAFLRRISCPTLVVHADTGVPIDLPMLEQRKACIDNLEVVHVEGGHHVHLDAPERVADAVRQFWGQDPNI